MKDKLRETVKDREAWDAAVPGVATEHNLVTEQQQQQQNSEVAQFRTSVAVDALHAGEGAVRSVGFGVSPVKARVSAGTLTAWVRVR